VEGRAIKNVIKTDKQNTFCTEPFKQVHFNSRGELGPCCQYNGIREHSINGIDDYLNSEWLANLKQSLENGEKISGCDICWKQEEQNLESMRQRRAEYYKKRNRSLDDIEHIMITFGNQCNTACRICNVSRSSLVEKQYKETIDTVTNPRLKKLMSKTHNWDKTKTWYKNIIDGIVSRADKIHKLEISGGEPMINYHYNKLIDNLIDSGKDLPVISVTTNGSFDNEQISKLENFDYCHINFSIDGVGKDYYEYLRWPLKWEDTIRSVDILKSHKWLGCKFILVPHNLNVSNLSDSIEWFKSYTDNEERFEVGFSWLNGAPWYSIQNSPRDLRLAEADKIEKVLSSYRFSNGEELQIRELITLLRKDISPVYLDVFRDHLDMTDKFRNFDSWKFLGWNIEQI
jgi:pyruvate-formate lyase-activating enzyme